jgi:hypothetical protein
VTDTTWSPDPFIQASFGPKYIAEALDVHRCTASSWLNRRAKPCAYLMDRALVLQCAVQRALDEGAFPYPSTWDAAYRKRQMKLWIRRHLASV